MNRRAELSHAANQRYLEVLWMVSVSTPLSDPIADGHWLLTGFRNRDLCAEWFGRCEDPAELRCQSSAINRKLLLLRVHGLIRKIEGTHRYLLTKLGRQTTTALQSTRLAKPIAPNNKSRSQHSEAVIFYQATYHQEIWAF